MEARIFNQQCTILLEEIASLNDACRQFKLKKGSLRWFGKGRFETQVLILSR